MDSQIFVQVTVYVTTRIIYGALKIMFIWLRVPLSSGRHYQSFGGTYCLHRSHRFQGEFYSKYRRSRFLRNV